MPDIEITYAEVDGTTKTDRWQAPRLSSQLFDGGRAHVFLRDEDDRVTGWAQYTRVSRVVYGSAARELGVDG
jgi:hypothetical protein